MNTKKTKEWVKQNGVITLKADKTNKSPEIDQLLSELGNSTKLLPFYAIYPGHGGKPIVFGLGPITQGHLLDRLAEAGPSRGASQAERTVQRPSVNRDVAPPR